MEDLINALVGGAAEQGGQGQNSADQLADLLGGMLSGGAGTGASGGGGLLESILGGSGGSQSEGALDMGGILGAIMGGSSGGPSVSQDSFLAPIVNALADKIGISPEIASMVVSFLVSKLLSGMSGSAGSTSGASPGAPAAQDDLDLDHLLTAMRSGEPVDTDYIKTSGMSEELAQQTGMDPETAAASLQEAFALLGGQMGSGVEAAPPAKPQLDGLDHLLDTW